MNERLLERSTKNCDWNVYRWNGRYYWSNPTNRDSKPRITSWIDRLKSIRSNADIDNLRTATFRLLEINYDDD